MNLLGRISALRSAASPAFLVMALFLWGCASVPELGQELAPAEGFALTARLGVRAGQQGFTGGLRWVHESQRDRLSISSPLGQILAELELSAQGALLRSPERVIRAESLAELMESELGWSLPLQGMAYWARAMPRPGAPFELRRDTLGRIEWMQQDAWTIEYLSYFEEQAQAAKPQRLILRHGELELRLVIARWAKDESS